MDPDRRITLDILSQGYLMSLGTVDDHGPWVSDVIYIFDDSFTLYWLSVTTSRHSWAVLDSPHVAASITVNNEQGQVNLGLQLSGTAYKLEGEQPDLVKKHLLKRKKSPPPEGEPYIRGDQSWYKLVPKRIEIIHEAEWAFHKHVFDL